MVFTSRTLPADILHHVPFDRIFLLQKVLVNQIGPIVNRFYLPEPDRLNKLERQTQWIPFLIPSQYETERCCRRKERSKIYRGTSRRRCFNRNALQKVQPKPKQTAES